MNGKRVLFIPLVLFGLLIGGCTGVTSKMLQERPEPVEFHPPVPERWQLENGLTVLFQPNDELPLVWGKLFLKGGSLWGDPNRPGAVSAMGGQMREGGTKSLSPGQLDRVLEEYAASIGSGFDNEFGSVSFSCLSNDVDKIFELFADVALNPRFDESRFQLWRSHALESVRRRKDDPNTIASVSFNQLLFGETPYGKVAVEEDVKALTRLDLLRAHRKFVRPNKAVITLTGDITRDKAKELVERYFRNWKRADVDHPEAPPVDFEPKPGIYFIEAPFTQATLLFGHQGVKRLSPDHIAIVAFNEVYGSGGFGSRLMKRVREELGLAYGVYGAILPGVVKGRNLISLQTKTESTAEAMVESLKMLQQMQTELVEAEELQEVQQSVQNSFVFRFNTPGKAVNRQAWMQLLEYPDDYDENYIPSLMALSPEEVRETALKRWDLSKMVIVVVGNGKAYNSLENLMKEPPEFLKGQSIQRVRFDQRLLLK